MTTPRTPRIQLNLTLDPELAAVLDAMAATDGYASAAAWARDELEKRAKARAKKSKRGAR